MTQTDVTLPSAVYRVSLLQSTYTSNHYLKSVGWLNSTPPEVSLINYLLDDFALPRSTASRDHTPIPHPNKHLQPQSFVHHTIIHAFARSSHLAVLSRSRVIARTRTHANAQPYDSGSRATSSQSTARSLRRLYSHADPFVKYVGHCKFTARSSLLPELCGRARIYLLKCG